ncbi:hypothetical protein IKF02_02745 [Candidatus Saccharibacteria bacterium]|nr:hypothetical protein [Candidatus Saccharibacteria bacterium]MBR3144048.1 hypothetical protein [Candidatus Saccharibacteria bacterium]
MFFDDVSSIENIALRSGCTIFVLPAGTEINIRGALVLAPDSKVNITIEQVREAIKDLSTKQFNDRFIIIRPAEKLGEEAANALLKNLEEPKEKVHFVLITDSASKILPTILSRSAMYFLRDIRPIDGDIEADAKIINLAKRFIVAKPADLPALAEEIAKKKDSVRSYALEVLAVTIEMLYKSYYKTGKIVFANKIPKFLKAYENIEKNGHIKLHLVADLL